jgi:hypothetical protein
MRALCSFFFSIAKKPASGCGSASKILSVNFTRLSLLRFFRKQPPPSANFMLSTKPKKTMQNRNLYQIDSNHSVIESTIQRLHSTSDSEGKVVPAALTNRTLCLGFTPEATPLLWIESKAYGCVLATDNPEQFAEFLADLTDNSEIERGIYARVCAGHRLFEITLGSLRSTLMPSDLELLAEVAANAVVSAQNGAVCFADVRIHPRNDWREVYLPKGANESVVVQALDWLHIKCESLGLRCVIIDEDEPRGESHIDITDEVGSIVSDDVRRRIEAIVREAVGSWESWAKKQNPSIALNETAQAKLNSVLAKIRKSGVHFYASDFGNTDVFLEGDGAVDWHITFDGNELSAGGGWISPSEDGPQVSEEDLLPFGLQDCLSNQPDETHELMVQLGLVSADESCGYGENLEMLDRVLDVLAEESQTAWKTAIENCKDYPAFFASLKEKSKA